MCNHYCFSAYLIFDDDHTAWLIVYAKLEEVKNELLFWILPRVKNESVIICIESMLKGKIGLERIAWNIESEEYEIKYSFASLDIFKYTMHKNRLTCKCTAIEKVYTIYIRIYLHKETTYIFCSTSYLGKMNYVQQSSLVF